jgi:hypothetical protein
LFGETKLTAGDCDIRLSDGSKDSESGSVALNRRGNDLHGIPEEHDKRLRHPILAGNPPRPEWSILSCAGQWK